MRRLIFRAMKELYSDHKPIDQLSVGGTAARTKHLEDAGGAAQIAELINRVPTAANIEYYANIVKEKYILRSDHQDLQTV
ncbi:MAG: DnaB-like helicase N-terminal domain-containing protein [Candidatus Marinimicrobia bacterium]|nr:DnaB-like helicase N-terminal domain-containing protein [Candidatus Neomarinimicrobiota bacterium]